MKFGNSLVLILTAFLVPAIAVGQQHGNSAQHSPYMGFESREIKSLSEKDIQELRRGGGWGLALAAELNGMPGPAHLLELKDKIPLTSEQVAVIDVIFQKMKAEAITAGERLISAEQSIEEAFRKGTIKPEDLKRLINVAETARAELRYIHLSRHLETPPLLTADQIAAYKSLRGYKDDPCAIVPEGHDKDMWRRHNGCK